MRLSLLAAMLLFAVAPMAQANLIINGGFEDVNVTDNGGNWEVFNSILGWTTIDGPGIEIQNNIYSPYEGDQYAELDSHNGQDTNSAMRQQVATIIGATYDLSFAFSARPNIPEPSNGILVYADGVLLDTVVADGSSLSDTDWNVFSYSFIASTALTSIEFWATGTDDTLGGFLDDVTMTQDESEPIIPEPATLSLLGIGLAGAGLLRRHRGLQK